MGRIDVFYKCMSCKLQRRGGAGKMFCDECGGELRSIGYVGKLRDVPPAPRPKDRRRG